MHRVVADRCLPIGAEPTAGRGVAFRLWAPKCQRVELCCWSPEALKDKSACHEMTLEAGGYYSTKLDDCKPATRYGFRLDHAKEVRADPASRFQPDGVFGLSEVIDPTVFRWSDQAWGGLDVQGQVIYEMHIGTFTPEGTLQAAARELPELARAGMTVIELMPLAEFAGRFGWGYDGVFPFAPTRLYGRPDDLRHFVNSAHAVGLGVILDVVFNHFGPVGNYMGHFSDHYVTDAYDNEWSDALNFHGDDSQPVRDMFLANTRYWIEEFHFDGFRFDATQAIFDTPENHILTEVTQAARAAAGERKVLLIGENEPQDVRLLHPEARKGYGLDALWNDDFHHAARVRLTGASEAYYSDYRGAVSEFLASVKRGFLYQGQRSIWQGKPRGTPTTGLRATNFVTFLENHDQVANSGSGARLAELSSPGKLRAMTALWLLAPQTPLFFQGQEFASSKPFLFFADFSGSEAAAVATGRAKFLAQFPSLATLEAQAQLHDPGDPAIFQRCQLDLSERVSHAPIYELHTDLLQLRREERVFARQQADLLDGAPIGADCFVLRYFAEDGDDRLLLVNFGGDLLQAPLPQPLLAPPPQRRWQLQWSSEDVRYGGRGTPDVETDSGWRIPSESALVLRPTIATERSQESGKHA